MVALDIYFAYFVVILYSVFFYVNSMTKLGLQYI